MRIALDAMGGDHAPQDPVRGAQSAIEELGDSFEIILVGRETDLRAILNAHGGSTERLHVHHAPDVIAMDDLPAAALRRKRRSSITVGLELLRDGRAEAFVSAGHTGAVMAGALVTLGRIENIARPAIVTIFPTRELPCLVLDVGANVESKPEHLVQFAIMGHIYARDVLGRTRPRVGLLSIGEEPSKGNDLTVATHRLLLKSGLNFIGNVEGRDLLKGAADVVVCDGFVGNVLLKFGESFVDFLSDTIREETRKRRVAALGALLMRPVFASLRRRMDYAEYGGAPLLGVNGVVIIAHGGSSVKAFRSAIGVARLAAERKLNRRIESAVGAYVGETATEEPVPAATFGKEGA
ncbi:MAG: phosphate acyltransferase PlsX [Gemmatimonadetes bacterium]|nr:phosphate acyltransferase PlsX [Gemmatimonadota bacterium]